jgi:hypothetical protein
MLIPASRPALKDEDVDDSVHDDELEDATERTPLIASSSPRRVATQLSPLFVSAIIGLLIGLIKPAQRGIVGVGADDSDGSWAWQSIGSGLVLLGGAFAVVEMVGVGAGIRAGEKKECVWRGVAVGSCADCRPTRSAEDSIPPTLGTVLLITAWRYVAIPAIVVSIVHGFRKIPSSKVYLQDPAFVSRGGGTFRLEPSC